MASKKWPTSNWPEYAPHEISGFEKPLFTFLDDSARDYPNHVYTIFSDSMRTFSQVKDKWYYEVIFLVYLVGMIISMYIPFFTA